MAFWDFSKNLEGYVPRMYADKTRKVTTGIGNLIDPIGLALPLSWRDPRSNGALATEQAIRAEWTRVKGDPLAASKGHWHSDKYTTLYLRDEDIAKLVTTRRDEMISGLFVTWPNLDQWPAPAQLALLSMCWAGGNGMFDEFPKFSAACNRMDFRGAAKECKIREDRIGGALAKRNVKNKQLFLAAAELMEEATYGLDELRMVPNKVVE